MIKDRTDRSINHLPPGYYWYHGDAPGSDGQWRGHYKQIIAVGMHDNQTRVLFVGDDGVYSLDDLNGRILERVDVPEDSLEEAAQHGVFAA